jgi:hypothetical protein
MNRKALPKEFRHRNRTRRPSLLTALERLAPGVSPTCADRVDPCGCDADA